MVIASLQHNGARTITKKNAARAVGEVGDFSEGLCADNKRILAAAALQKLLCN